MFWDCCTKLKFMDCNNPGSVVTDINPATPQLELGKGESSREGSCFHVTRKHFFTNAGLDLPFSHFFFFSRCSWLQDSAIPVVIFWLRDSSSTHIFPGKYFASAGTSIFCSDHLKHERDLTSVRRISFSTAIFLSHVDRLWDQFFWFGQQSTLLLLACKMFSAKTKLKGFPPKRSSHLQIHVWGTIYYFVVSYERPLLLGVWRWANSCKRFTELTLSSLLLQLVSQHFSSGVTHFQVPTHLASAFLHAASSGLPA